MKQHASMNRSFRLVRNELTGALVAAAENARGRGKGSVRRLAVLGGLVAAGLQGLAFAAPPINQLPTGGQIVAGAGSISQSANALTVRQSSDKLVANWSTFNIGQNASVQFVQPGSASVALNRIADTSPSQIFGKLSANGQVFLLNPQGIVFGTTARVDVGALVASSLDLSTANFLSGNYQFAKNISAGGISNAGQISANGGAGSVVAFIAPQVTNTGSITATGGQVALAAGDKVSMDFAGTGLIKLQVDQGAFNALVDNKGLIQADGGAVIMTAKTASDLMATVVNNEGTVQARTLQNKEGRILLLGDMTHGETRVAGTLDASAPDGGNGGFIETSAAKVKFVKSPRITTHASAGKSGTWLIDPTDFTIAVGGDMDGATLATNLQTTDVTIQSTAGAAGVNGDIFVNDIISVTAGAAAHTLTLQADRNIVFSDSFGLDATGNGFGINTVLWANTLGAGGSVTLGINSPILTNGGHLWIGGGNAPAASPWNGLTVGNGYAQGFTTGISAGIYISNGIISTSGGHIAMYGKSALLSGLTPNPDGNINASGIVTSFNEQYNIDSGTGTILLSGLGVDTNTSNPNGDAVYLNGGTLTSAATTGDAITIVGDASAATTQNVASGITLNAWDSLKSNVISATGGGNIVMTGSGGTALPAYSMGVRLDHATTGTNSILTTPTAGNITITGTSQLAASYAIGASTATGIHAGGSLMMNGAGGAGIQSFADLTGSGNSNLSAAAGDLLLGGNITTVGTTVANTLLLQSARDIVFGAGTTLNWDSLNGIAAVAASPVSVVLQSNYTDAIEGGAIVMLPGSAIATKGGSITFTGGSAGSAITGYAVGRDGVAGTGGGAEAGNGIAMIGATLSSAGGNITLRGKSASGGNVVSAAGFASADGVLITDLGSGTSLIDSGTGSISIEGLATGTITAAHFGHGVSISQFSTLKSSKTTGTAINILGDASGVIATTGSYGLFSDGTIEAVGGGDISIAGIGAGVNGSIAFYSYGAYFDLGNTLASGGSITINGTGSLYGLGMNNTSQTGTIAVDATAVASNVSLTSNSGMVLGGPISAASAIDLIANAGLDMQGLISTPGTVDIQAGSGFAVQNYGGSITAANLLVAAGGGVDLKGQTYTLGVVDDGSASLNNVGAFAANVSGPGLIFMNTGDLTIGVGAVGVSMTGAGFTAIGTSGNLTIAKNVSSSYDGSLHGGTSLALVAGNRVSAGTATGGDITVTGGATVTIPATANAGLFSGNTTTGSASLAALISPGNFRYNSSLQLGKSSGLAPDIALTANYVAPLGTGLYAVYREQPTATITAPATTYVYGQLGMMSSVTPTVSGLQNGDTLGGFAGVSGVPNINGLFDASITPYSLLLPSTLLDLGYNVVSTGATVTINPAPVSLTGTKTYDGLASVASTALTTGALVGTETLTISGTGSTATKNVGAAKALTLGSLALVDGTNGGLASNYTFTGGTQTVDITPASISAITGITAANRAYDGTTVTTLNTALAGFTGMIFGDTLTVASSSGAFADKNAGIGKTVDITGLSLGGADVANYTLASTIASASADISQANLTVSTSAVSKTYDANTTAAGALVVTAGTLFAGDTLNGGTFAFTDKNVGAGNKIVTVSGVTVNDGNAGNNYILAVANNLASTITPFAVNLTGTKTYDGLTSVASTALTIGALPGGENLTISGAGTTADKNVGTAKPLTLGNLALVDGTTGLASNYTLTGSLTVDITPANLSINGATAASRPFDGTTVTNITGAVLSGIIPGDTVIPANHTTGNFADAAVGTAKLVTMTASLTGADAVNYSLTQPTGLTADITAVVTSTPGSTVVATVQKTAVVVNSPSIAMPTQQTALITYEGVAPAPLPSTTLASGATPSPTATAEAPVNTSSTDKKAEATQDPAPVTAAPEAAVTTAQPAPVKPATQTPAAAAKTVAAKAAAASPKAAANKQAAAKAPAPAGRAVPAPSLPNTGLASRLAGVPPGLGLRPPMVHLPVPPAIKNFAAAVPDVVGQKYPLLAESKIVPKEPEHDIRSAREDEMAQSFDSLPSPHNPGRVTKGNQSKASIIYEETLELVNFLNLMTLKIVP